MAASPQMSGPPKKGLSPLVIILIVIGVIVVLGGVLTVAGGLFLVHKVRQAGVDPDLMQRNPALAVTKMLAAVNPDVEVVRVDEGSGKITLRDKKSGKVVAFDFEQIKQGKISFEGEEGKVTIEGSAEGEQATLRMHGPEGSYQFGAGKLPAWAPAYPGAAEIQTSSSQTPEGQGATVQCATDDSVEQVMKFYKERLEGSGFQVHTALHGGEGAGGMVTGRSSDEKRNATVLITTQEGRTAIAASFFENK
ncbi:MAG: hypothetical protein KIT09_07760 [Bryobacteraceae bacterium]|nr:hypothetical protein [Bryobacteraceae bacterium]